MAAETVEQEQEDSYLDDDDSDNIPTAIIQSVVKIFVTHCGPWYSQPWEMDVSSSSTSSGFIYSTVDRAIICNAHGVVNHTSIRVRKFGESKKYNAKLRYIGHDCDLAILTVEDDKFWRVNNNKEEEEEKKTREEEALPIELEFSNVTPSLWHRITVLGYPKGGDDLSVTQGVVSRVGFTNYSHSLKYLLTVQIDAAINDGNSGGPCLDKNYKVVGVAFQGIEDADNIGYCIPVRVIHHFIKSYQKDASKAYSVPCLALVYSNIENQAMKQYLNMIKNTENENEKEKHVQQEHVQTDVNDEHYDFDGEMQGILVDKLYPFTDTAERLKKGDVILQIEGTAIGDDGTIKYGKNSRIDLNYIITNKFDGDSVELRVLRQAKILNVKVEIRRHNPLCAVHLYDSTEEYFIFGGLVFLPLSRPYLQHKFGRDSWTKKAPSTLTYAYFNRLRSSPLQQCIVLTQVLAFDEINVGYQDYRHDILECIECGRDEHGKEKQFKIDNLAHLAHTVDELAARRRDQKKSEGKEEKFIKFKFESQHTIVLNIDDVLHVAADILQRYKIQFDRSKNLRSTQQQTDDQKTNDTK